MRFASQRIQIAAKYSSRATSIRTATRSYQLRKQHPEGGSVCGAVRCMSPVLEAEDGAPTGMLEGRSL